MSKCRLASLFLFVVLFSFNPLSAPTEGSPITDTANAEIADVLATAKQVAAGDFHTCALTSDGGVKCWGSNFSGQLGDSSTTRRTTPVDVSGLTSDVLAVAADGSHTCAATSEGSVMCWGDNDYGQLGDGTTTDRAEPVHVSGLSGAVAIAAGTRHTCAVTSSGGVRCWGDNNYGQLGDGTTTARSIPVEVSGLSTVLTVSAGESHTCALTSEGGVKCWGANWYGQLGDGTTTARSTPVPVSGQGSGVAAVAAGGAHTCAVSDAGGVKCWGLNEDGQLGDGTTANHSTPVPVSGQASGVTAVAAGGTHTCALNGEGGVKCWGWNEYGQLGDGTTTRRTTPVDVSGLTSTSRQK